MSIADLARGPADLDALAAAVRGVGGGGLTPPAGLPGRPWYRHQIYAPGQYTGYGVKTLPSIREALELRRWQEAEQQVVAVAAVLDGLSDRLEEISKSRP